MKEKNENSEQPIMVLQKNADRTTNRIIIPKALLEQWGRTFYMEIYADKIILKPKKRGS